MDHYAEKTDAFEKWVRAHYAFVSPKLRIEDRRNDGMGRAVFATEHIKSGEKLFQIGRECILNVETAAAASLNDGAAKEVLLSLNQWQALIVCLAYEWYLNGNSKLSAYLDVLPLSTDDFSSLMFWNEEELQMLKPSGVLQRIGRDSAEEMHAILVADIIPNQLNCQELADFLTIERFHIVASIILSYSFDVDHPEEVKEGDDEEAEAEGEGEEEEEVDENDEEEQENASHLSDEDNAEEKTDEHEHDHDHDHQDEDEDDDHHSEEEGDPDAVANDTYYKSMIPLADTLNSNTTLCNAKLNYEQTSLVMIADKDIAPGEQIYNIYGELPNSEILRKYGYVELPSSKFEFAELYQPAIKEFFQDKFAQLEHIKPMQAQTIVDVIFDTIEESEYLAENLVDEMDAGILFDKYEIYAKGEVLPELLLLLLIVTSIYQAAASDPKWFKKVARSVERKPSSDLLSLINRTILKSNQLLGEKSLLTQSAFDNLKQLVKKRISEYPGHITDGSYETPSHTILTKKEMADTVLYCEVQCFKDILDGMFPPLDENGAIRFKIIEDEKFLKNLLKRKLEELESKKAKKQRN